MSDRGYKGSEEQRNKRAKEKKMASNYSREGKGFRNLVVWQRAHELTLLVYRLTKKFPKEEVYGLKSQMRRAASSVPANIVEGQGAGQGNYKRHLLIAKGSLAEVEYFLILANDLRYLSDEEIKQAEKLRAETGFLLYRLIQALSH